MSHLISFHYGYVIWPCCWPASTTVLCYTYTLTDIIPFASTTNPASLKPRKVDTRSFLLIPFYIWLIQLWLSPRTCMYIPGLLAMPLQTKITLSESPTCRLWNTSIFGGPYLVGTYIMHPSFAYYAPTHLFPLFLFSNRSCVYTTPPAPTYLVDGLIKSRPFFVPTFSRPSSAQLALSGRLLITDPIR